MRQFQIRADVEKLATTKPSFAGKAWGATKKVGKYGLGALIPAGTVSEGYKAGRDRYGQTDSTGKIIKDGASSAATMGAFGAMFGTSYWSPLMKKEHSFLKQLPKEQLDKLEALRTKRNKPWYNPFKKSGLTDAETKEFKGLKRLKRKTGLWDFKGRGKAFANNALWSVGIYAAGALGGRLMKRKHEKDVQQQNNTQNINQVASSEVPYISVISFDVTAATKWKTMVHLLNKGNRNTLQKAGMGGPAVMNKSAKGLLGALDEKFGTKIKDIADLKGVSDLKKAELQNQISKTGGFMFKPDSIQTMNIIKELPSQSVERQVREAIKINPKLKEHETALREQINKRVEANRKELDKVGNTIYTSRDYISKAPFINKMNNTQFKNYIDTSMYHEGMEALNASRGNSVLKGKWRSHTDPSVIVNEYVKQLQSGTRGSFIGKLRDKTGESALIEKYLDVSKPIRSQDIKKAIKRMRKDIEKGIIK